MYGGRSSKLPVVQSQAFTAFKLPKSIDLITGIDGGSAIDRRLSHHHPYSPKNRRKTSPTFTSYEVDVHK